MTDLLNYSDMAEIAERIVAAFRATGEAHARIDDRARNAEEEDGCVVRVGRELSRGWQEMGTVLVNAQGEIQIWADRRGAWIRTVALNAAKQEA